MRLQQRADAPAGGAHLAPAARNPAELLAATSRTRLRQPGCRRQASAAREKKGAAVGRGSGADQQGRLE